MAVAAGATDGGTWGNDGGGGGVSDEPDIIYQGTAAQSRKVSTSVIGRSYTATGGTPASIDHTNTDRRHTIFKINATNYSALLSRSSPAMHVKIGSGSGAYYSYYLFGNDNYPVAGGWQIIAVSPNVSGYRDATTGSPTLTAVAYWSLLGDFSATAKAENLVIDAIDVGGGLYLTGGTSTDPDGTFADFVSADEGNSSNRWGFVRTLNGIMFCVGRLAIGEGSGGGAAAAVFQDATGQVLVWENGLVETGFHEFRVDLGSSSTDVDITGATFDSVGQENNDGDRGYTTTEDSRLTLTCEGTQGDAKFIGCTFRNLRLATLVGKVTLDTCDMEVADLHQGGAEIFDSVIRTTSAANVATCDDVAFGTTTDLRNTEFIQAGSGHAIELTTATTYNLTGIGFTGYGADTTASAALFINVASGTVTINVTNGDTPTYRLPGGSTATVTINNSVNVDFSGIVSGSRLYVEATDTVGSVTTGDELVNANVTVDPYTYAHNYEGDLTFLYRVRKGTSAPYYVPLDGTGTITDTGFSVNISQVPDS
jgi:hypothetical protein